MTFSRDTSLSLFGSVIAFNTGLKRLQVYHQMECTTPCSPSQSVLHLWSRSGAAGLQAALTTQPCMSPTFSVVVHIGSIRIISSVNSGSYKTINLSFSRPCGRSDDFDAWRITHPSRLVSVGGASFFPSFNSLTCISNPAFFAAAKIARGELFPM